MRTRRVTRTSTLLLVAGLVATLGAVGPAGAVGAQEASPSPTASPPPPVEVTQADSGRTVHLVTGQELQVRLTAPEGEQWQGPPSVDGLYLVRYEERSERTHARLQALRTGTFALQARTDRRCFHTGDPCPQGFSQWSLQVVVDEGPAPSTTYPCAPAPTPSVAPGTTLLERQDHGRRVRVPVGERVWVHLGSCDEDPFQVAQSSGPLFRSGADLLVRGVSSTHFEAASTGTTTITADTDPPCFHVAQPCARPFFRWSVEVEVVPAVADDSCLVPAQAELDRGTLTATGAAVVTVRTTRDVQVDLYAYTRPSTTFRLVRSAMSDGRGVVSFTVRPPANTRLYAQKRGCAPGPSQGLNVATALTLTAQRTGPREYVFAGDSLPARPGGLVVSLYRVTGDGREVLTAQTRAGRATGEWRLVRRFSGTGRFGFVVRTGQDLQNAPGASGVRSLLVF